MTYVVQSWQVHTLAYPDGAIRAQFSNASIITGSVEAVYGAALVDPFSGNAHSQPPSPALRLHFVLLSPRDVATCQASCFFLVPNISCPSLVCVCVSELFQTRDNVHMYMS